MKHRSALVAPFMALAILPGCFCVSWRNYEPAGPNTARGSFEDDFSPQISSTRSGFSIFIQNSGPPYSLETTLSRSRSFEWYSIDSAILEWSDGHRETLATPADGFRAVATKPGSRHTAKLALPRTFHHVPAEGTEVTLHMRVTVRSSAGTQAHHLKQKFRFTHEKGCQWITLEALMGA